ncbi:hypothetical protein FGO68_gene15961 [Halteria grandinella]|uniref:Uncharacterized protein n=1 Tax=Halteria grandinella TaxID=5974 RepID=A0A8J8NR35_HALGN|nr:hypothetical protein FGO68_gene15961 [Halteria grandinella]
MKDILKDRQQLRKLRDIEANPLNPMEYAQSCLQQLFSRQWFVLNVSSLEYKFEVDQDLKGLLLLSLQLPEATYIQHSMK